MNGTGGEVHQRARRAGRRLAIACELDLALDYVKRLVPVMAVRRRARTLVARLVCDLLAL
jgi:hypothetical protein